MLKDAKKACIKIFANLNDKEQLVLLETLTSIFGEVPVVEPGSVKTKTEQLCGLSWSELEKTAAKVGVSTKTVYQRLTMGMSLDEALTRPISTRNQHTKK